MTPDVEIALRNLVMEAFLDQSEEELEELSLVAHVPGIGYFQLQSYPGNNFVAFLDEKEVVMRRVAFSASSVEKIFRRIKIHNPRLIEKLRAMAAK